MASFNVSILFETPPEIEPNNELYQRMLDAQSICIYVPAGFQDISIELIAVINS